MAKKKKKKKLKKKKFKPIKLVKLLLFLLVIGSGIALWKPDLIQDEQQRQQVLSMREYLVSQSQIGSQTLVDKAQVLGAVSLAKDKLPKEIVVGNQEIYVDEALQQVASELEMLPAEQFKRFKANFCADLVASASATTSATTSSSN